MRNVWVIQSKEGDCPKCSHWENWAIFGKFEDADARLQMCVIDLPEYQWRMISRAVY